MPGSLTVIRILTLVPTALCMPLGTLAVYGCGADRVLVAKAMAWTFSWGLVLAFSSAWWPLPSLRDWTRLERARSSALLFLTVSAVVHLTWEFGWLVNAHNMMDLRGTWWAWIWWAYIEGGDARYGSAPTELVVVECISLFNGILIAAGLWRWHKTKSGTRLLAKSAVIHLVTTSYYFLSEVMAGLPNVNTADFTHLWILFVLANLPWLVMPCVVLWWTTQPTSPIHGGTRRGRTTANTAAPRQTSNSGSPRRGS